MSNNNLTGDVLAAEMKPSGRGLQMFALWLSISYMNDKLMNMDAVDATRGTAYYHYRKRCLNATKQAFLALS